MIDINAHRGMYVITPAIATDTDRITYLVSVAGSEVFAGQTRYFGGTYEIDTRDWLDSYLAKQTTQVNSVTVSVAVTCYDEDDTVLSTHTYTLTWKPEMLGLSAPPQPSDYSTTYCNIELLNCGFEFNGHTPVRVPLMIDGLTLRGKTINNLEKVTYMDKYGDTHNGSTTNSYELECFIDPDWLNVKTNSDLEYEKVMLALQCAQKSTLKGCGAGGFDAIKISGMFTAYIPSTPGGTRPLQFFEIPGRVKDVKKIETYSAYSNTKKVPTIKITFEIYYR